MEFEMNDTYEAGSLKKWARQKAIATSIVTKDCRDSVGYHDTCLQADHIAEAIIEGMKAALERAKTNRTADCVNCQGADIWIDKEIESLG